MLARKAVCRAFGNPQFIVPSFCLYHVGLLVYLVPILQTHVVLTKAGVVKAEHRSGLLPILFKILLTKMSQRKVLS